MQINIQWILKKTVRRLNNHSIFKKKKSKFSGNYVTFQALKGQPVSKPNQTKTINSLYFVSLCEIIYIYILCISAIRTTIVLINAWHRKM